MYTNPEQVPGATTLKTILILTMLLWSQLGAAQVHIGNGGDDMRLGYKLAAKSMANKVENLLPCSFTKETSNHVISWLLANREAFSEDIRESANHHKWVEENRATCAYTLRQRNAETTYSFSRCLETGNTRTKAEKIVVHESVHHFGFSDEKFPDQVAQAVFDATTRVSCPRTKPDPNRIILKSGRDHSCAIYQGKVSCWGEKSGLEGLPDNTFTNPRDLAIVSSGTCVLDDDTVRCFHDGGTTPRSILKVPKHNRVEAIFGGYSFACMIERAGTKCWGGNHNMYYLEEAIEPREFTNTVFEGFVLDKEGVKHNVTSGRALYLIPEYENPRSIVGALTNFCVLEDRGVVCRGPNNDPVAGLDYPTSVAVGEDHGCAIDGTNVRCWGKNYFGQAPQILEFSNPYAISAGDRFSCAADDDGVYCWGDEAYTNVPPELIK